MAAEEVVDYLAAFDLASLPQSVDRVGSFRYSTKLCEYLAVGLPIITGQIPAAYDLDAGRRRDRHERREQGGERHE